MSYYDCEEFIKRLNENDLVKAKRLKFRLPTKDEWQTMRGENQDPSTIGDYAWTWENSNCETHGVAQKKVNKHGLYDVFGNVAEWCSGDGRDYRFCYGGSYLVGGESASFDQFRDDFEDCYSTKTCSSTIGLRLVAFKI